MHRALRARHTLHIADVVTGRDEDVNGVDVIDIWRRNIVELIDFDLLRCLQIVTFCHVSSQDFCAWRLIIIRSAKEAVV